MGWINSAGGGGLGLVVLPDSVANPTNDENNTGNMTNTIKTISNKDGLDSLDRVSGIIFVFRKENK
jgi:hypothetical protein